MVYRTKFCLLAQSERVEEAGPLDTDKHVEQHEKRDPDSVSYVEAPSFINN